MIEFDEALWVTEAGGAPWLADTGLPLDERGFVAGRREPALAGRPAVFAAGDVATMPAHPREKAGVYAVRAGPPLADNLRRALAGRRLRRAVPQRRALALIGTGDERAVASRGPFAAYGRGLWRLKDWIDRRWMRRYTELPAMAAGDRRTRRDALRRLRRQGAGRGAGAGHGAARPAGERCRSRSGSTARTTRRWCRFPARRRCCRPSISSARWSTTRICSGASPRPMRSATSMRWAALPETALAIATLPPARPPIVEHDLFHMLNGGTEVLEAAGAVLVGGHSAEGAELGPRLRGDRPHRGPGRLLRKGGLRPGDRLILTKPLGTGVILAAEMRGLRPGARRRGGDRDDAAIRCRGVGLPRWRIGATACTDVTGFGLLGHLLEMLTRLGHAMRGSTRRRSRRSTAR